MNAQLASTWSLLTRGKYGRTSLIRGCQYVTGIGVISFGIHLYILRLIRIPWCTFIHYKSIYLANHGNCSHYLGNRYIFYVL